MRSVRTGPNIFRTHLALDEISNKAQKYHLLYMFCWRFQNKTRTADPKNVIADQGAFFGVQSAEDAKSRSFPLHFSVRHPSKYVPKTCFLYSYMKQVVTRTNCITAMLRSILRTSILTFNLVFQNWFYFGCFRLLTVLIVAYPGTFFFGPFDRSHLWDEKKEQKKLASHALAGAWTTRSPCK